MKLSEMTRILAEEKIRLMKSLGQNFLHDGNQLRRIVEAAELKGTDQVFEIGPGLGPLTELLLERAGRVLAVEKDERLARLFKTRFGSAPNLELHVADAVEFLARGGADWSEWKMVANLPYSVASSILVELSQIDRCPERVVTTLQLEVARRLCAKPGSHDYGILTLLVAVCYEAKGFFKIPGSCFFPAPEVDSACVTLVRRESSFLAPEEQATFVKIVKRGFSQRRKMMLKLLKETWPVEAISRILDELGIERTVRAEQVTLDQFLELTRRLGSPDRPFMMK